MLKQIAFLSIVLFAGVGCAEKISSPIIDVQQQNSLQTLEQKSMGDISRDYLIGGWKVVLSKTDGFDSIILNDSGEYFTHVNNLPLDSGTWIFDGIVLSLVSQANEKLNLTYGNLDRKGGDYLLLDRAGMDGDVAERTWQKQ